MNWKNTVLISVAFVIVMIIIANFAFQVDLTKEFIEINEGELQKNKAISFVPGEEYAYFFNSTENSGEIIYSIEMGEDCIAVYIAEQYTGVCFNNDGTDEIGSNISLSNPQVLFFKPWMLALKENWTWNVNIYEKQTKQNISEYHFEVIGQEEIFGRDSFVVEITSEKESAIMWIDQSKRVILKEIGQGYKFTLTHAPFELEI